MSFIDWQDIFYAIFQYYDPDQWTLRFGHRNDLKLIQKIQKQRKMKRTGYASFHCPKCSNQWTSAKAQVVFYFPKSADTKLNIHLRFYGQLCRKCSNKNSRFVDPEFDEDWIYVTLWKVYEKVGWWYYGEEQPASQHKESERENNINGPHEKDLCEACKLGCCDQ